MVSQKTKSREIKPERCPGKRRGERLNLHDVPENKEEGD